MDLSTIVQHKLVGSEKSVACVLANLLEADGKKLQTVALVKGQEEHGVFFYNCLQERPQKASHLSFDSALPVSDTFKFVVENRRQSSSGFGVIALKLTSENLCVVLEVTEGPNTQALLAGLKHACQVQSQNACFGLPSTFSWIEKYRNTNARDNPFLEDVFDPMKPQADDWALSLLAQQELGIDCPVVGSEEQTPVGEDPLEAFHKSLGASHNSLANSTETFAKREMSRSNDELSSRDLGAGTSSKVKTRDNLIKLIMNSKHEEYTESQSIRVFCGTWNTNGQAASESCRPWLSPKEDDQPPDIYAIGFQELDLSKNAYIFTESGKEEEWYKKTESALHKGATYKKLRLVRLVGIMIIVYVRDGVPVKNVTASHVGTGLMGMMGNKGGVAVRLEVHNTSLCFVNTHLAAHTAEYERRNQDFRDINSRMSFSTRKGDLSISEHDIVFWIGDLNYRLSDIDNESVKQLIASNKLAQMIPYDQLHQQREAKRVFVDYQEAAINFIPTYKYDTGTDDWDTSEKCRAPAWCDRILWRGTGVQPLQYRSHMEMRVSDHKPVSALFDTQVHVINQSLYRSVYEDTMKQLDRMENDFLPQVELNTTEVVFSSVKFIEPQTQAVTVKNTGQVPVQFEFINKLNDDHYCKPWLNIEPSKAVINVGHSCTIQFEVYVNRQTAPKLNSGDDKIEDILILHLEGGKDLFITVSGTHLASCFGASIEALVHMFGPIRDVETASLIELEHGQSVSSPTPEDRPLDIPKEIWRLVDHLFNHGLEEENLFLQPGLHSEIQLIRDSLDTGTPSTLPGSVHSVAEALLIFLEATMEPVIPYLFYHQCLEVCNNALLCQQLMNGLPVSHNKLFHYICAFLRKCLLYAHKNNLEGKDLARLFGGLLLRAPPKHKKVPNEANLRAAFVYNFISSSSAA